MTEVCEHRWSEKLQRWICFNGHEMCDDHITHLPCPYDKEKK